MAVRMLIDMHRMTLKRQREEQQRHSQQHRQPQQQQHPRPAKQGEQAPAHPEGLVPEAGSGAKLGDEQDGAAAGHAEGWGPEDGTGAKSGEAAEAAARPERQSAGTQTEAGTQQGAGQAAQSAGTQTEGRPPGKEELQGSEAQQDALEGRHSQQGIGGEPQLAAEDSLGQLSMAEIDGEGTAEGAMDGSEADELAEMNPICPLHDEHLPIDANSLKGKQVRLTGWPTQKLSALCMDSLRHSCLKDK